MYTYIYIYIYIEGLFLISPILSLEERYCTQFQKIKNSLRRNRKYYNLGKIHIYITHSYIATHILFVLVSLLPLTMLAFCHICDKIWHILYLYRHIRLFKCLKGCTGSTKTVDQASYKLNFLLIPIFLIIYNTEIPTTNTNNSLKHLATWGQHSCKHSSSILVYSKVPLYTLPRSPDFI